MELYTRIAKINDWVQKNVSEKDRLIMNQHIEMLKETNAVNFAMKIGDTVPQFKLENQRGESISSVKLLRQGPLVMSFYRGSWCPYCVEEVNVLNALYDDFRAAGTDMVVISPQSLERSHKQATELNLKFDILVDKDNSVGKAFGLVYEFPFDLKEVYLKTFGNDISKMNESSVWELPIPARFVIDVDGTILSADVDPDYRNRSEPSETLAFVRQLKLNKKEN